MGGGGGGGGGDAGGGKVKKITVDESKVLQNRLFLFFWGGGGHLVYTSNLYPAVCFVEFCIISHYHEWKTMKKKNMTLVNI